MPNNRIALEILSETGPLAVSSANLTGEPAAMTALEAEEMLGESVAVYLDGGRAGADYTPQAASDTEAVSDTEATGSPLASTIVDATGLLLPEGKLRIVRSGVIPDQVIRDIVGDRCE
jgi:tRNA A37 threonylcarbamoyladenosine synthetase subunit TsaC/SUA5/YrdC